MIRRLRSIFLVVSLTLFSFVPVRAENTETTIRVGCVDIDNFLESQGDTVIGYGADLLQEVSVYTGWNYEYVKGTWSECLEWLKEGKIDLLMPAEYSDQRAEDYLFSDRECCTDYVVLLCNINNDSLYYEDYENYNDLKIGMIKDNYLNDCFEEFASENAITCERTYYDTGEKMQEALRNNEVDAVVTGNLDISNEVKILAKFSYMPAYFIMNKNSTEWMSELNSALYTINLENPYFIAQLYQTYYGSYGTQAKEFTREESDYIKTLSSIKVVCDSHDYPFEYFDSTTKEYKGIDIDILKQLSLNSGITFEYVYTSTFDEAWKMIQSGEADIIAGVYLNQVLSKDYNVSPTSSYITESSNAIYLTYNRLDLEDNLTVAIKESLVGTTEYIHTHYPNWTIQTYPTSEDCLRAVNEKRADITFVASYTLQTSSILHSYPSLGVLSGVSINVPLCLGISDSADSKLQSIMNKTLKTVSDDQIQQYIIDNTSKASATFSLMDSIEEYPMEWMGIVAVFCIIIAFAFVMLYKSNTQKKYALSLQAKNDELAREEQITNTFFTQLSHDMRTPMNAILGFSRLGKDIQSKEEGKEYFEKIHESGNYLMKLIDDSLQIGKITTGKTELKKENFAVLELKDTLNDVLYDKADQKGLRFIIDADACKEKSIESDKHNLQEILVNLLNNAIKFTPCGGCVSLKITPKEEDNTGLLFTISDSGIGMSEEFMEKHLFESFAQEQYLYKGSEEGTGLGLSIVKRLVDAMQGTITCTSKRNQGTTFNVFIPCPLFSFVPKIEEKPVLDDSILRDKHLLVCEDNKINLEIVTRLLEKKGMLIDSAADGKIGVEKYITSEENAYDAILMDIRMPNLDGLEASKAIRSSNHPNSKDIPIIAMTANAYPQDIEKSKEAGMNVHLSKPVEPEVLYEELVRQLSKKK